LETDRSSYPVLASEERKKRRIDQKRCGYGSRCKSALMNLSDGAVRKMAAGDKVEDDDGDGDEEESEDDDEAASRKEQKEKES
jgi:hypothetical protein